ncbi:MAG: PorV/PorQ family protein [candidate division Zixibacteria bacterium]|nr:PorV/PorQ family protein [candidate division Zixibacteria bacterium]
MLTTRILRPLLLSLFIVMLGSSVGLAGDINADAGTSAFPFLKINMSARPVAMGGAFTGLADDESALYYNPAGLAGFETSRFIAGYHNYFVDIQSGFLGYIRPLDERRAVAFHLTYLSMGDFVETDAGGNVTGNFGGGDLVVAASFAMKQTYQMSVGVTAKFIYEKISEYSATGVAVDVGARYSSNRGRYSGGIMIQNLGAQLSTLGEGEKDGLPTVFRGGAAARPKGLPLQLVGDLIVPFDNDIDFAIGAEYYEIKPLYLRLGYNTFGSNYRAEDSDDSMAGLTMGFGLDYKSLQISYAYAPGADLGDSHRVTITGGF